MEKTGKPISEHSICADTKYSARWRNAAIDGSVCARDAAGARAAISDAQVSRDARRAAGRAAAAQLACDELPCPVGPCSQQGARVDNLSRREQPYNIRDTGERGDCAANETRWTYRVRIDADIEVQCDCPQPA